MKKQKYIIWSFDEHETQTFLDIRFPTSPEHKERLTQRPRPYATLDLYCRPLPLADYVSDLIKELAL